ncbi:lipoprotein BA_5634 family protein [Bacillus cereus]|uniref:lipoprotein BA_5634 family protein n=1 Tax=Bacillus cereus TaxID=1396 RepID=UPI0037BE8923
MDLNKSGIKEKDTYKTNLVTLEGKNLFLIDKKSGGELAKKRFIKKVETDATKVIDKLTTVTANQGILELAFEHISVSFIRAQ